MSNDTTCQMTQSVKWHKISNDTKYQMAQNVKWHEISNDTKWHMTYDTWQMTNKTWQMTHETKFQIAHYTHDTWHMIHDTWHMRYDVWCMTHDAWWSMTPDRNTRRHTLRSVHSSPGRPLLKWKLEIQARSPPQHSFSCCIIILDRNIWRLPAVQFHFWIIFGYELNAVYCSS